MPSATSNPTPVPQQTLTLPHDVIATINPSAYLLAHLHPSSSSQPPLRPSGRTLSTFRPPTCNTSSLTHCAGSSVIRVGDTAVVCGIQAEILKASDVADPIRPQESQHEVSGKEELASLQLLVPNVELATGCSPAHLPGGPPSGEAQVLVQRLYSLLHSSNLVDIEDLRIKHKPLASELDDDDDVQEEEQTVAYWTLYASIHVMSLSGSGSLVDVCWAALLAALKDVRLPKAVWNPDIEEVICSDRVDETKRLSLRGMPISCTWGVFKAGRAQVGVEASEADGAEVKKLKDGGRAWFLADPDEFEDPLCRETVTITVDATGGKTKVLRIEKSGGCAVGMVEIRHLVSAATERWKEWDDAIGGSP